MLFGLVVSLCWIDSLVAKDWAKVGQDVLSFGSKPEPIKEAKLIKGCPVDDSYEGLDPLNNQSHVVINNEVKRKDEVLYHEVVVFVSFSMPEASLRALSKAAAEYNAVLVMRGLYEDSFVKTSAKLQQI